MTFKEELKNKIDEKRNIRESTLNAYIFNLNKLHKLMRNGQEINSLDFLKKKSKVDDELRDKKKSTKKTYYASIIVGLMAMDYSDKLIKEYRDEMEQLAKDFNNEMEKQRKSDQQNKNWASLAELKKVMRKYRNELNEKGIFQKNPDDLSNKEFDLLQKYVVASLYIIDDANPPPRNDFIMDIISNEDYNKLSEEDKKKKNYLIVKSRNKKVFSLGEYKTSGKYGTKLIDVGKKLNSVLNIWLKFNKTKHLLLNSKKEPMTPNGLTKYLNKVFEPTGKKNISSSMIRHIYISEKFPPILDEKKETADKMGHSVSQQELYSKK